MALIQGIVDTQKQNLKSLGIVNSGDDLTIELEVKQNGVNIEFVNPIFELLATKSDGTRVRQLVDITYIGNVVNIIGDEQLVTSPGIVTLQLIIKDNKRSSTCLFYFMCGTSLDRDIIQSISKVEVLNQLDEYVVQAFANLKEYEQRIIASDASIRNLNEDMIKAEKVRVQAEINRGNTFDNLVLKMNNAINAAIATDETLQNNEIKRIDNYNTLKAELESIKDDLILLNNNISKEEEKRVQAEIDRVNKTLEIIEKLKSTNDKVTIAEAERVTEFNNIKSELTSLKEALTTINNIANSNEEIRKTNESGRVAAEQQRVTDFEKIKSDNTSLGVALTKKVDDKIVEIEANNNTFKQGINEQYEDIVNKNNEFKEQMNTDFGNAKTDYFGEEHLNVVDRLNSDFDNVHQRINDSSYLEYSSSNITADNTYYGLTKELNIKGRTLQNLVGEMRSISKDWIHENGLLKLNLPSGNGQPMVLFYLAQPFKRDTLYTFVINVAECTSGVIHFCLTNETNSILSVTTEKTLNSVGTFIFTLKTKTDVDSSLFRILPRANVDNTFSVSDKILILEGDYTNTPIEELPFGEGIYSVGESEITEEGKYKISWKSCGKNLLDLSKHKGVTSYVHNGVTFTYNENTKKFTVNGTATSDITYRVLLEASENERFVRFNPNSNYKFSVSVPLPFYIQISEKNVASQSTINPYTNYSGISNLNNKCNYIMVWGIKQGDVFENLEFGLQVEEGTVTTDYEPYQETVQELQLSEPLRSLPNGTADEITEDGTEIRRIGKIVLDGSENWGVSGMAPQKKTLIFQGDVIYQLVKPKSLANSDKFATYTDTTTDEEGILPFSGTGNTRIYFRINKSKLITQDVKGFKQWLSQNPTTVYYELAKPIITKHNININLKTYDRTTHITSDNYLQATISCKVPSNVQATIMNLKEENEALNNTISLMSLENEEIKTVNETQDELIDVSLCATDEMFTMLEPILEMLPQTINLEREREVKNHMVDLYVAMVMRGLKTIDEVPARYREQVKEILAQLEK